MLGIPLPISRRRLVAALLLAPIVGGLRFRPAYAADPLSEGAQALVQAFANEGVLLLEDKAAAPAQRAERFRALLDKYFAMSAIAQWVLGRYWNQFGAQERRDYQRLFEDLVVYGYVKRFGEYTGQRLRITRTLADNPTQATVFSQVERAAGGQPIHVDWRVGTRDSVFKITDVVVENVSLGQTWRSDFSATIQQGGSPAKLLQTIGERTAQLKADLGVSD